ncbi:MAG TPA: TA system VapC family ribonuclease toxin [Candidatus Dormibacteraeota bacterium]|nr:TA system VapC family ribonuclease toxin [Candidatus Dormibacteraeota bacterium]
MIVLDANVLLYAYDSHSPAFEKAKEWLEGVFSDGTPIGLPWQTILAFLRISTDPRLPGSRFSIEEASSLVDRWLEQPNVRLLSGSDEHWPILRATMKDGQARGPLVGDAHLAALAISFGATLYTTDRDFARFPGLRWANPLA